ncbi:hypothetical protein MYCOZU2_02744 [Mycobacterium intracellulare subsp. chimaera]|uniref:Uncharacterized protein n=1 Tax=Mycobacterium intracellulare subsp. chimaera TaxID=222805 RepID=A0A7U5RVT3_MYCIT|nr:hypothetical protein MYCOZU2_02744 [Mycobacterium intracellulare subsp. chimaera]
MPHDSPFALGTGKIFRPITGLGFVPPFVATSPGNATSHGLPVFGAAFQAMTQTRLEQIYCLARGVSFHLSADQSPIDIEVRLRDHAPGKVPIGVLAQFDGGAAPVCG